MKTIKFILKKIITVEIMLLILYFAKELFHVDISIFNLITEAGLYYLTPVAIASLLLYIIFSIFTFKTLGIIITFILAGIVLYFIFSY